MERAAIVVASHDADIRGTLSRELSSRYAADYQIVVCDDPDHLDAQVRNLVRGGTPVALVVGGLGTEDPDGLDVQAGFRAIDPTALRVAAVRWVHGKPRGRSLMRSPWARSTTGCIALRSVLTRTSIARSRTS